MAAVDQVVQHATRQGWPTSKLDVWHGKCLCHGPSCTRLREKEICSREIRSVERLRRIHHQHRDQLAGGTVSADEHVAVGSIVCIDCAVGTGARVARYSKLFENHEVHPILEIHDGVHSHGRASSLEGEPVGICATPQRICARVTDQRIRAGVAVYLVVAVAAIELIIPYAAIEHVVTGFPTDEIVAGVPVSQIVATADLDPVVTVAAMRFVDARFGIENVVAVATVEVVVAVSAIHRVGAVSAINPIVAGLPLQGVVAASP